MNVEWNFTAQTYLDQLSSEERVRTERAVGRLRDNWDALHATALSRVTGGSPAGADLLALQVGHDLRVLLRRQKDTIVVVDVVRRGQIEGLRGLRGVRAETG